MEQLEQRVRQLEMELLGEKFKNALIMDKLNITIEDMKTYATACLDEFPESEKNTDMYYCLIGMIKGEEVATEFLGSENL